MEINISARLADVYQIRWQNGIGCITIFLWMFCNVTDPSHLFSFRHMFLLISYNEEDPFVSSPFVFLLSFIHLPVPGTLHRVRCPLKSPVINAYVTLLLRTSFQSTLCVSFYSIPTSQCVPISPWFCLMLFTSYLYRSFRLVSLFTWYLQHLVP